AGTIPACAGEPPPPIDIPRLLWDYPRVCGGTVIVWVRKFPHVGLSPRVRGNHSLGKHDDADSGTVPACAGEPRPWASCTAPRRDYPRVCGGTGKGAGSMASIKGLSPRVRGNRPHRDRDHHYQGTIPACAGE